ncbi:hypothetical protein [Parasphingorhabdus sp.]|jgi:hypothetical protein|uniref:hypothetical protein n=1 Tax=Parasphingorhabdus sp. TaxID=2709688 RepID=UPI003D283237
MKKTFVYAGLFAAIFSLAGILTSAPAVAASFEPVHIETTFGVKGNGARFRARNGCITITARHVVNDTTSATITPVKSSYDRAIVIAKEDKVDAAILRQPHQKIEECPRVPSNTAIENALFQSSQREVWYVNQDGVASPINVDLVRKIDGSTIELELVPNRSPSAPIHFVPGMSGSIVVFNGVPIAVLTEIKNSTNITAVAILLSFIIDNNPDVFASPVTRVSPPISREPYKIKHLPKEVQEVVKQARRNKRIAERRAKRAEEEKIKAENAAAIARQYPNNQAVRDYAHFLGTNGNKYAGQVQVVGTQYFNRGYGITIVGPGPNEGNSFYCTFERNVGCNGIGVTEFEQNEGNSNDVMRWAGGYTKNEHSGFGILTWYKDDTRENGSKKAWYYAGSKEPIAGVWEMYDGRLFEGKIQDNWDGIGALWDADGKLIQIGIWKDGKVVENWNNRLKR